MTLLEGDDAWILVHIEVQGTRKTGFCERIFVYNYRIFDRHRRPVASLVVLADESPGWRPYSFSFDALGCRHSLDFPTVKLLDYAGREDDLVKDENPFALVTLAHLLTRVTRDDMAARYAAKWKLVRLLYERDWDRQRVIGLFTVIDWLMRLPEDLSRNLWREIETPEERTAMRYVTSVERFIIERNVQQGRAEGKAEGKVEMLLGLLRRKFGSLSPEIDERVRAASSDQLDEWSECLLGARELADVFDATTTH